MLYALFMALQPAAAQSDTDVIDYSTPKSYEIGGITVSGTQYVDENVLLSVAGLSVGDKINIPGEHIPKAINALWQQGLFADVKIIATKIVGSVIFLDIQLKERPRLSKYTFEGTKKSEEDDLRSKLNLVRGRIVNDNLLSNARNTIAEYYRKKGFLNAYANFTQTPEANMPNTVVVTVDVHKGKKVRIGEIEFEGNENINALKLRKQMSGTKERAYINLKAPQTIWHDLKKTRLSEALGNLSLSDARNYISNNIVRIKPFSSSKFIEDDYEADKAAVIDYYNEKGFRDARIVNDTVYAEKDDQLHIRIKVDEGRRYYFRNIDWKGNSKYSDEYLSRILGIKKGDIYNQTRLQTRLSLDINTGNDISSLYMDDGYLFFQATPTETAIENDSIDLVINIYEGAQATIDRVLINGNTKTKEHVIRRALYSVPGDKFSRSDLIRSNREIASLGFFDPEQIQINPIPNPQKGTVDIEYTVAEKPSDQLELSVGWGGRNATTNKASVVGTVGVSFNNFSLSNILKKNAWKPIPSGDGQRLSLRFQSTGPQFQSLNMAFTEPWLGGKKPNSLSVSLMGNRSSYTSGASLIILGGGIGFGKRLKVPDDNFIFQAELNYQEYRLKNWFQDFIISNGRSSNLSLKLTLSRISIDQPTYPRSGSNFSASVQFTPPYSLLNNKDYTQLSIGQKYRWAEYHKWRLRAEWFLPITNKLVLRTAVKMGMMGYYNSDIGHTPFERFELGGDGIANYNLLGKEIIALRGYDVVTNNRVIQDSGNLTNVGDPYFAKYTVELRYPLSLNPSSTIYGLGFLEAGKSWNTFKQFNPFEVYRTAGLGLRILLPMFGTLGFDYGLGFDKTAPTKPKNFSEFLSSYGKFTVVLGVEPE